MIKPVKSYVCLNILSFIIFTPDIKIDLFSQKKGTENLDSSNKS